MVGLNGDGLSIDANTIPMDGRVAALKIQTPNLIHDTMQRIAISRRCKPPCTSTVVLSRHVGPSVSIVMLGVQSMSVQKHQSPSLMTWWIEWNVVLRLGFESEACLRWYRYGW